MRRMFCSMGIRAQRYFITMCNKAGCCWRAPSSPSSDKIEYAGLPRIPVLQVSSSDICPVCLDELVLHLCACPPARECTRHLVCLECYEKLVEHNRAYRCVYCARPSPPFFWRVFKTVRYDDHRCDDEIEGGEAAAAVLK